MAEIPGYPLQWPAGKPRTRRMDVKDALFRHDGRRLTFAQALKRLMNEADLYTRVGQDWRIPLDSIVVSCNIRRRKADGTPYSGEREPDDAGVAVYFTFDGQPKCLWCDKFYRVADNLAGIAAAIGHMRALERHVNGEVIDAAFTGFAALPETIETPWRSVLGLAEVEHVNVAVVRDAHRRLAQRNHPDRGGSAERMAEINRARDQALEELGG